MMAMTETNARNAMAVIHTRRAIKALRRARDLLVKADAPNAAERVRKALKSAEGAERNALVRFNQGNPKRIKRSAHQ